MNHHNAKVLSLVVQRLANAFNLVVFRTEIARGNWLSRLSFALYCPGSSGTTAEFARNTPSHCERTIGETHHRLPCFGHDEITGVTSGNEIAFCICFPQDRISVNRKTVLNLVALLFSAIREPNMLDFARLNGVMERTAGIPG